MHYTQHKGTTGQERSRMRTHLRTARAQLKGEGDSYTDADILAVAESKALEDERLPLSATAISDYLYAVMTGPTR